jgi:Zn-dependent protease with chaperone function
MVMTGRAGTLVVVAMLAPLSAAPAAPSPDEVARDEFEAKVLDELSSIAPSAMEDARGAAVAYEAHRAQEAYDGYARVLVAAPRFDHALRRQCVAKLALGEREVAIPLCRAALAVRSTAPNEMALAQALATSRPGQTVSQAELDEAIVMAIRGMSLEPNRVSIAQGACDVALRANNLDLLKTCAGRLQALAPDDLSTKYSAFVVAASLGEFRGARRLLGEARSAGLPEDEVTRLTKAIDSAEPAWSRWRVEILWVVGAWAAVLPLLLVAGAGLSSATLRRARSMVTNRDASGNAAWMRRTYAVVLWLTCAVYYLSLPLVVVLLLGAAYAVWLGFESAGHVPVYGLQLLAMTVLLSLWAVARSVWVSLIRPRLEDPGVRLPVPDHPHFEAAMREVAERVGTRPVDEVFLTPATDAAVYERGAVAQRVSGRTQRCLILGVGLLDGMTQGQLKAVLAHEYGHFVNRDTAGGGLALAARRSMLHMGQSLASGGVATWYNPTWLFVKYFHRIFLRVSLGASRLQEILADQWAVRAYGGANFAAGLAHTVATSVRFQKHADAALREVVDGELALPNLYQVVLASPLAEAEVAEEVEKRMKAEPSPYDSHPRPVDRITWTSEVSRTHGADPDDDSPAWALFADREALERRLTDEVRARVATSRGVKIVAEPQV